MRFSTWFRRAHQPAPSYRPTIDLLEDRVVPAAVRHFPVPVTPPATHLKVIVPQDVEAGKAFSVIVEALDRSNHVVTGFRGTVQLTLANADAGATLPASFTFSAADHGKHTLQATLTVTGAQTVKARSGVFASKGSLSVDAVATHFSLSTFGYVIAGVPTIVNVTALDANNNAAPGYLGTVHFSSTDLLAILPDDYTFTTADGGSHLFSVTFGYAGSYTIAVHDAAQRSIAGGDSVWAHWSWYDPGYSSYYPYSSGFTYPVVGFTSGYPVTGVVAASNNGIVGANPIGNISYGANPFGNVASLFSPTNPIANISYGLNRFGGFA